MCVYGGRPDIIQKPTQHIGQVADRDLYIDDHNERNTVAIHNTHTLAVVPEKNELAR